MLTTVAGGCGANNGADAYDSENDRLISKPKDVVSEMVPYLKCVIGIGWRSMIQAKN